MMFVLESRSTVVPYNMNDFLSFLNENYVEYVSVLCTK